MAECGRLAEGRDIAMGLSLQPTARPHPVQIAVNVKLQQIGAERRQRDATIGMDYWRWSRPATRADASASPYLGFMCPILTFGAL